MKVEPGKWTGLAQDHVQWQALVLGELTLRFYYLGGRIQLITKCPCAYNNSDLDEHLVLIIPITIIIAQIEFWSKQDFFNFK
jgi:hypothetical protein